MGKLPMPSYKPVESKIISASEFLELRRKGMPNIKDVMIEPATLGSKNLGGFKVTFKNPELTY